jgi:formylglycine-generating enzyme required for sulfatase activity
MVTLWMSWAAASAAEPAALEELASPPQEAPATWDSPTLGTFRLIPAGTFTMGCVPGRDDVAGPCEAEPTPRAVTLPEGYYLMEHEVTRAEWRAVMGEDPPFSKACGGDCPARFVSWHDAQAFVAKVSALEGVAYRLPTEAEWEWAARGGASQAYAGSDDLAAVAWSADNARGRVHEVCGLQRNGYGLCDMTGNVWEWVQDVGAPLGADPQGAEAGSERVVRGGSWRDGAAASGNAERTVSEAGIGWPIVGFRVLRPIR